jgi:hypothetical protein
MSSQSEQNRVAQLLYVLNCGIRRAMHVASDMQEQPNERVEEEEEEDDEPTLFKSVLGRAFDWLGLAYIVTTIMVLIGLFFDAAQQAPVRRDMAAIQWHRDETDDELGCGVTITELDDDEEEL